MDANQELLDQVRKSIEEKLPAMQVDVFRQYMTEADKVKKELDSLKISFKSLNDESVTIKAENSRLKALELDSIVLKNGLATLELEKLKFDVTKQLKDADVKSANEKVELVKSMTYNIFRNIDIRRSIMGMVPVIHKDCNGNNAYTSQEPSQTTETESQD